MAKELFRGVMVGKMQKEDEEEDFINTSYLDMSLGFLENDASCDNETKSNVANSLINNRLAELQSILKNSDNKVEVWNIPDFVEPNRLTLEDALEEIAVGGANYSFFKKEQKKKIKNNIKKRFFVKLLAFVLFAILGVVITFFGTSTWSIIIPSIILILVSLGIDGYAEDEAEKITRRNWIERAEDLIAQKWQNDKKTEEEKYKQLYLIFSELREKYLKEDKLTIGRYISSVLDENHGELSFYYHDNEVEYIPDNKMAIIDCMLPAPDEIPSFKEVRYIKSKDELRKIPFSVKEMFNLYDDVIYQLCLCDINQIFLTDDLNKIDAIVYNGWVKSIDKTTGKKIQTCILSLHVSKEKFSQINLKQVDPKECFRGLKGVGSTRLYSLTAVPPIMKMNKEDSRFIESRDVAHTLDESINLAAMDWQDFEHLIREIFSKILSVDGIDVRVTQSSKDRGVDAVAFDPDPIRGGKIVIQAKRYTNVVGVSAVRDLYGTLMNEGAMKGILVTTSHFGNDAYEFIKGKPLTLISGGELLSLFTQQGYKTKINLKEAKEILNTKRKYNTF